ncbi:hypothetical protein JCM30566_00370 [Marinitoga arctica]
MEYLYLILAYFNVFDFDLLLWALIFLIVIPKHIENIIRIIKGTEIKVNERLEKNSAPKI